MIEIFNSEALIGKNLSIVNQDTRSPRALAQYSDTLIVKSIPKIVEIIAAAGTAFKACKIVFTYKSVFLIFVSDIRNTFHCGFNFNLHGSTLF